jgi:hypothetical protein
MTGSGVYRRFGPAARELAAVRYASDLAEQSMDLVASEWVVETLNEMCDRQAVLGTRLVAIYRLAGAVADAKDAVVGKFTQRILRAPDIVEDPLDELARTPDYLRVLVKQEEKVQFDRRVNHLREQMLNELIDCQSLGIHRPCRDCHDAPPLTHPGVCALLIGSSIPAALP